MNPDDAEEYTAALGQVVAGGYRQVALGKRLGVPEALGLSVEDWVEGRLGGFVKLSLTERRNAVAELSAEGLTQREIAEVLGVANGTVANDEIALRNEQADIADEDEQPSQCSELSGDDEVTTDALLDRAAAIADVLDTVKTERRPKPTPAPPAHPAAAYLWARLGDVRDLDASDADDDQRSDIAAAADKWTDELTRLRGAQ